MEAGAGAGRQALLQGFLTCVPKSMCRETVQNVRLGALAYQSYNRAWHSATVDHSRVPTYWKVGLVPLTTSRAGLKESQASAASTRP